MVLVRVGKNILDCGCHVSHGVNLGFPKTILPSPKLHVSG